MRTELQRCKEDEKGRCCEDGSQGRGGGRWGRSSGDANKMKRGGVVGMRANHSNTEAKQAMAGGISGKDGEDAQVNSGGRWGK
jgi:hypothetical protein